MTGITELMFAAGVVGFLAGSVATAMFFAWAFWPCDSESEQ